MPGRARTVGAADWVWSAVNACCGLRLIVRLVDVKGRQATLSPLSIKGEPDGRLVWNYDASIPGQLHIKGQAAPAVWNAVLSA